MYASAVRPSRAARGLLSVVTVMAVFGVKVRVRRDGDISGRCRDTCLRSDAISAAVRRPYRFEIASRFVSDRMNFGKVRGVSSSLGSIMRSSSSGSAGSDSWLSKLLVRRIEPTKESHSRMLSDKEVVYGLYTHNVRPDSWQKYLENYKTTVDLVHSKKDLSCELVASWTVSVGDLDQALHLWKYDGGFERVDNANAVLSKDASYVKLLTDRGNYLRNRHLQYVLAFSYWPSIVPREGKNIYEVRSYSLKPGTMIEWGNNWARAINYRRNNDEAFAGFFSQIGRLYNVHHVWCYRDLQARRETRESAWRSPGWDECVAYTVPLIREMHCRILEPTAFSPTQ